MLISTYLLMHLGLVVPIGKAIIPLPPAVLGVVLLCLLAIAYAGTCLALYLYQAKLIFNPSPILTRSPTDIDLVYEDVWIPVQKNLGTLHGWWLPNPETDRVLLFCHGNYGNISHNLELINFHRSLGFNVLAFDYRGYGQSTGKGPTEQSTYADAEAAWQYLITERQLSPKDITVLGHSMGGAIAIDLATKQPHMARLIVKSSFTKLKDIIDLNRIYDFFPIDRILVHTFDSLSKVSQLTVPVLYVHGDQDTKIPTHMSQQLYDATPGAKQLWVVPDVDHNYLSTATDSTSYDLAKSFFAGLCRAPT